MMTYKEMYDHLAADLKKVKIKEEYLLPKAVKDFRKETRFPSWRWYEYTISLQDKIKIYTSDYNSMTTMLQVMSNKKVTSTDNMCKTAI